MLYTFVSLDYVMTCFVCVWWIKVVSSHSRHTLLFSCRTLCLASDKRRILLRKSELEFQRWKMLRFIFYVLSSSLLKVVRWPEGYLVHNSCAPANAEISVGIMGLAEHLMQNKPVEPKKIILHNNLTVAMWYMYLSTSFFLACKTKDFSGLFKSLDKQCVQQYSEWFKSSCGLIIL